MSTRPAARCLTALTDRRPIVATSRTGTTSSITPADDPPTIARHVDAIAAPVATGPVMADDVVAVALLLLVVLLVLLITRCNIPQ